MDDSLSVRGSESIGDLDGQIKRPIHWQRFAGDALPEGLSLQILHGDKRLAFMPADAVDGADVGMVQSACCGSFALEALDRLWVAGPSFRQELQRYLALQFKVPGFVDHAHTAGAERLQHAKMIHCAADE